MNALKELWRGDQRYSIKIDREKEKAWIEYPSGVSQEIEVVTAESVIRLNGMKKDLHEHV